MEDKVRRQVQSKLWCGRSRLLLVDATADSH